MIDLTTEKEDKSSYIVNVDLNDDETYIVTYADGHTDVCQFSVHNFMVEMYKMEEQYEKYGKDYLERIYPNPGIRNSLIGLLLANNTLYFISIMKTGINIGNGLIFTYCMVLGLRTILKHVRNTKLYLEAKRKLAIINAYMENKEQFKIKLDSSLTNEQEDWYLVNLSNIDDFKSIDALNAFMVDLKKSDVKDIDGYRKLTKERKEQIV